MELERRRATRYPFVATAEVVEVQSETRWKARATELSLYGCYLDMLNPLPVGTQVRLRVTYQNATFEALGRVAYSQPNLGAGVGFATIEPASQALLEKWLSDLTRN